MFGDLDALFGGEQGDLKEDLFTYGVMGGSAIAANMLMTKLAGFLPTKADGVTPVIPPIALHAGVAVLGIVAGNYVSNKFNKNVGQGVAVGLMIAGLGGLLKEVGMPIAGLGDSAASGANLFDRFLNGAPATVEQVNGLSAAPASVESVRQLNGVGSFLA